MFAGMDLVALKGLLGEGRSIFEQLNKSSFGKFYDAIRDVGHISVKDYSLPKVRNNLPHQLRYPRSTLYNSPSGHINTWYCELWTRQKTAAAEGINQPAATEA